MQKLIVNLLMKSIRHGLTAIGGGEALLSDDQSKQLYGALTFLIGFGWSVAEAIIDHRKAVKTA